MRIIWLTGAVLLLSGCFFMPRPGAPVWTIDRIMQIDNIPGEIEWRESLKNPENRNDFILAVLYTHPRNPNPDCLAAEKHLDKYLAHLPPEKPDRQAAYIYGVLRRVSICNAETGRIRRRLEQEKIKRQAWQSQAKSAQKKLKATRAVLEKSKRRAGQLRGRLKKTEKRKAAALSKYEKMQNENNELKEKLKELTDLYLDLEKKRQAMQ